MLNRWLQNWIVQLVLITITFLVLSNKSIAITRNEPVELEVPATTVKMSGLAAPDSIVTISEGSVTVASVTADSSGAFNATITTNAGIHSYKTQYVDKNGVESQVNIANISVQPQQETSRSLFLSPTITLGSQSSVQRGSIVVVKGYGLPNKLVNISLDYGSKLYQTSTDSFGYYEYFIRTEALLDGNHTVSSTVISGVDLSDSSKQIIFNVQTSNTIITPDIVVVPGLLPPPVTTLPQDGAFIDGDSVTIYGESIPNGQINIYENGIAFGSIFSDDSGKWSFFYRARFTPVIFTFEVCKDGRCSVQSQAVTINFTKLSTKCSQSVGLEEYRFWGIDDSEEINLKVIDSYIGDIFINWGDDITERFSIDKESDTNIFKGYENPGNYSGSITFSYSDCEDIRYFSVNIQQSKENRQLWVFVVLVVSLLVGMYASKKDEKK